MEYNCFLVINNKSSKEKPEKNILPKVFLLLIYLIDLKGKNHIFSIKSIFNECIIQKNAKNNSAIRKSLETMHNIIISLGLNCT